MRRKQVVEERDLRPCRKCHRNLHVSVASLSFAQIKQLLKVEDPDSEPDDKTIRAEGPLCNKCLAARYAAITK
jgi:hypothetical protein